MTQNSSSGETYFAFGDDSVTPWGAFYGFVLIPEFAIEKFQDKVIEIKKKYGGNQDTPIHCRELFHSHARLKSEWKHLSEDDAIELCGDILRELAILKPKYLLGHIPSSYYPKRFRLIGKNGHPDLVHDINEKWLTLRLYFEIAGLLDPVEIIEPSNPILKPRPRTLPFWRVIMKRTQAGFRVRKVFLDREETPIRWFSKSFKWVSVAKELIIDGPLGKSHLPVEVAQKEKHSLLELADIFTYSIARSMYPGKSLEYRDFTTDPDDVNVICLWGLGEEIVFGGSNTQS